MKLLGILISALELSHSASGRVLIGEDNTTWSPTNKVPPECKDISKYVKEFIHVHTNDLDSTCDKFPFVYKTACTDFVHSKYSPDVICEALKILEPREKTYWLSFLW